MIIFLCELLAYPEFWKLRFFEATTKRLHILPPFFENQKNTSSLVRSTVKLFEKPSLCSLQDEQLLLLVTSARGHENIRNIYRKVYQNIDFIKKGSNSFLTLSYRLRSGFGMGFWGSQSPIPNPRNFSVRARSGNPRGFE